MLSRSLLVQYLVKPRVSITSRFYHMTKTLDQQLQSNQRLLSYKIKNNTANNVSFHQFNFQDSNIEPNDLELCLQGHEPMTMNLTWLRDSCHCDQCTHQQSRQRLFTIKNFRRQLFSISEIQLLPSSQTISSTIHSDQYNDSDHLSIKWSDGHKSVYSLAWLQHLDSCRQQASQFNQDDSFPSFKFPKDDLYGPTSGHEKLAQPWDVARIGKELVPIDYNDLVDGFQHQNTASTFINANKLEDMSERRFNSMLSLMNQLVTYGLAKVFNVPQERDHVLKVARSLAYERPTGYGTVFDVVVEPSEDINLAYTALEFDLHTDLPYRTPSPGVQLLHCIRNSSEGGSSYFSDAFHAAQLLRQAHSKLFEVLVRFPVTFMVRDPYRNVKLRHHRPVISLDYEGNLSDIYYSPFMLPPIGHNEDLKLFYLAMDKFTRLLQAQENKMIVKMEPGEMFMFHNRRVLHGRSAYDASKSARWLQGCYMDLDEIKCLYDKLLRGLK